MIGRRDVLRGLALTGAAGLAGWRPPSVAAEPPPETTRLRLIRRTQGYLCSSAQYAAEELLRGEGFTEVQYVPVPDGTAVERALATGETDISIYYGASLILRIDAGDPIVILAGAHVGCYELVATGGIRTIHDLKGKTVAGPTRGIHPILVILLTHVGLDPNRDVTWLTRSAEEQVRLLAGGKVDAVLALPPVPQELRARRIGRIVSNGAVDRPWSQYFCCVVAGHREFVRTRPAATRRALRAFLKATDLCGLDPDGVARRLVEKGYAQRYDYAQQTLRDLPYGKWREYDVEDAVRFYALRLHEAGAIKSSPQKILAQGTDWRFLNELKKELKG